MPLPSKVGRALFSLVAAKTGTDEPGDVVVEDEDCAKVTPIIIVKAVTAARQNFIMSGSPVNALQARDQSLE
jgi:hypothetical protein